ncbi:SDR family oxidoreductase [Nordella sp. HKS 07]|uniref:SDR family NAD(P)-dependent oxidoreductase n=1 Tax=Nordella sp. HKS 07 TaxID=2712222 RepID=UPI0013E1807B|nr:SDR family NAD(P)-dependent oxidoreductase [Nordella sp. HKS 07]QIG47359.1 SDR family oxidoreductase [Nordella sp. HKS 07]
MSGETSSLLAGKTAFITGGAQGIGLAVAEAYLKHGARVIAADIDKRALGEAKDRLATLAGDRARVIELDVTDAEATEALAERLFKDGGVDIVVPNAGILVLKRAVDLELATWRRVLDINLTGAFITATAFARRMIPQGKGGRIILTSSLFGLRGGVENGAYSASKFGMIGLMQCLAAELAGDGILVNCVCPGQMDTAMMDKLFDARAILQGKPAEELKAAFKAKIPLGELGKLDDLAGAYVYLASDLARYVVGQSLVIDGGWQVG